MLEHLGLGAVNSSVDELNELSLTLQIIMSRVIWFV